MSRVRFSAAVFAVFAVVTLFGCSEDKPTGPETDAPYVVSVTPAPGATEVATNTTVTITVA